MTGSLHRSTLQTGRVFANGQFIGARVSGGNETCNPSRPSAAGATLGTKNHSVANTLKQGLIWGLGHTITLLLFGSMVFLLEAAVPEQPANLQELGVGVMLITR